MEKIYHFSMKKTTDEVEWGYRKEWGEKAGRKEKFKRVFKRR